MATRLVANALAGAPLVDQINFTPDRMMVFSGAVFAVLANVPTMTLRQNQNDAVIMRTALPGHWQTFAVDVVWSVGTVTAGGPTLRIDTLPILPGTTAFNTGFATGTSDALVSNAGQYAANLTTVEPALVADVTKQLVVRLYRLALTPDGLASNIGVSLVQLRRTS